METERYRAVVNSQRTQFAAVLVGTFFIFFYVVMPITLGAAAESRGYDDRQLGFVASSFMLGVFVVTGGGMFWIRRYPWRRILWLCAGVALAAYAIPLFLHSYVALMACLLVAGAACGAGYSVTIACLGDADVPERGFGLTWGVQTFLGVAASYGLPRVTSSDNALEYSLWFFIALILVAMLLIPMMPDRGVKDGKRPKTGSAHDTDPYLPVVYVGFAVIVLVFLAESGIWAFLDRIAVSGGMSREFAGTAIAASLLAAAGSSFLAAVIGNRIGRLLPMTIAIATSVISVYLFYISDSPAAFLFAAVIYGAAWNFGGPYRMALIADADVSGRYVATITSMQTLGSIIGPGLAGMLATGSSYNHVYLTATLAWVIALVLFVWANNRFEILRTAREPTPA